MKSEEVYLSFIPFVDSGGFKLTFLQSHCE